MLKLSLPRSFKFCLLLSLLRFAEIEQEALFFLGRGLREFAKSRLPQTKGAKGFALLQPELSVLRAERADAFAQTAHELLPL